MSERLSNPNPTKAEELANVTEGTASAIVALALHMERQQAEATRTHHVERQYPEGSTQIEVTKGVGAKFEWSKVKHNGAVGTRTDGSIELKRPLDGPPGKEGRVAVAFDNGKSLFVQDGVAYVFGTDGAPLKSLAVEEISDITIGARDSVKLFGVPAADGQTIHTDIIGKPTHVMVEDFNPDLV